MKRRRLVSNPGPPRFITIRTSPVPFKIGILTGGTQTGMAFRFKALDGKIIHAAVRIGDSMVEVGEVPEPMPNLQR